jgi:chromosome segregation ATPase
LFYFIFIFSKDDINPPEEEVETPVLEDVQIEEKRTMKKLRADNARLATEKSRLDKEKDKLQTEKKAIEDSNKELKKEKKELKKEAKKLTDRIGKLETDMGKKADEITDLKSEKAKLKKLHAQGKKDNVTSSNLLNTLALDKKTLEKALEKQVTNLATLQDKKALADEKNKEKLQKLRELQTDWKGRAAAAEKLAEALKLNVQEGTELQSKDKIKIDEMTATILELTNRLKAVEDEEKVKAHLVLEQKEKLTKIKQKYKTTKHALHDLGAELNTLKDKLKKLESENAMLIEEGRKATLDSELAQGQFNNAKLQYQNEVTKIKTMEKENVRKKMIQEHEELMAERYKIQRGEGTERPMLPTNDDVIFPCLSLDYTLHLCSSYMHTHTHTHTQHTHNGVSWLFVCFRRSCQRLMRKVCL